MYRLYVDEVGTDGLTHLDKDKHRYLSLTGIAMRVNHARDVLEVDLNRIKADIFDHDPDSPLVFHRKEILGYKGVYQCLRNKDIQDKFNNAILQLFNTVDYTIITALIDKKWMLNQYFYPNNPYHYLMEILVEKYAQFLKRQNDIGDIMPEGRSGKDKFLQSVFKKIICEGTDFLTADQISSFIRTKNLKFRKKKDNIAGLQLCDLLAHPSHIYTRSLMKHDVNLGPFAIKIVRILKQSKYDRSTWAGKIIGYGIKHLPQ